MFPNHKIWGESNDGKFEFVSLTEDLLNDSLEVIRQGFFPYESVCIATDVAKNPEAGEELIQLCRDTAKDGVSIVAVEKETGTVAAVAFNKIQIKETTEDKSFYKQFTERCRCESARAFVQNMIDIDEKIDLFEYFHIDSFLEIMFIATREKYLGKQLGTGVCEVSIALARSLIDDKDRANYPVPKIVVVQLTSHASQKIGEKLKLEKLIEFPFDGFFYKGVPYSTIVSPDISTSVILEFLRL